jgi:2-methylisocitrate lyase-like PEP mutase family enzyme
MSRLFRAGRCQAAPGIHDALTARIATQAGHGAVYLGGNALAMGLAKGQPFVTLTETVEVAARICRSVSAPLLVDAGAGFGELGHLDMAVRELESTGAAGLHLDDQPYPKSAGYHRGQGQLVPAEAMAARLRTAVAARRSTDFAIVARTDSLRVTKSIDDALARCAAYVEAGANALMVLDLGIADAQIFRLAFPNTPLVWIGGVHPPVPSLAELEVAGFSLACYPFNGVAKLTTQLADLWGNLHRSGTIVQPDEELERARKETLALVDMQRFWNIEDGRRHDDTAS